MANEERHIYREDDHVVYEVSTICDDGAVIFSSFVSHNQGANWSPKLAPSMAHPLAGGLHA